MPDRLIRRKPHEPAEEQVVFQLLHQHAFATDGIEQLQQQRAQQPLRRNRLAAVLTVDFVEAAIERLQGFVHHCANRTQRMMGRHSFFE